MSESTKTTLFQIFLISTLFFLFSSCSAFSPKESDPRPLEAEFQPEESEFQKGLAQLGNEQFEEAITTFNKILESYPHSEFSLVTLFNKASALEGLKRCEDAAKIYRQTVQLSGKKFPFIEAQSLFRLSYCYECLGDTAKQIASLKDSLMRRKYLPPEVVNAELPARLAAAYAKIGNRKYAEKYFNIAQIGLKRVHQGDMTATKKSELLARTLFFMGQMQPDPEEIAQHPESYLAALNFLQAYLLKSAEMRSQEWSPKASKNLKEAYFAIWDIREQPPQSNPVKNYDHLSSNKDDPSQDDAGQTQSVKRKWQRQLAIKVVESIEKLKSLRFPDTDESPDVKGIFAEIEEQEKKWEIFLTQLAAENELTPDALRKEGLRRQGKVRSPASILERKSKTQGSLPPKKKASQ